MSYDIFLSYQSSDKDEARAIYDGVEQTGRKCFLAERSLKPGDTFTDEIRNALKSAKEFWLLLSPNSLKSEWVQRECSAAWALDKRIVPILLRCSHVDLPDILSQTHSIDYHNVMPLILKPISTSDSNRRQTPKRHTAIFRTVAGQNSKVINAAGDINYHPKITRKNVIQPGAEHVSPAQALEIKNRVVELATMEANSGRKMNPGTWYNKLYRKFDITSYLLTPVTRYDEMILWLQQQAALLRPKLRRTNNPVWRKSLYKGIWARARELEMSKEHVHEFAEEILEKAPLKSLSDLGERDLKAVYDALFRIQKK